MYVPMVKWDKMTNIVIDNTKQGELVLMNPTNVFFSFPFICIFVFFLQDSMVRCVLQTVIYDASNWKEWKGKGNIPLVVFSSVCMWVVSSYFCSENRFKIKTDFFCCCHRCIERFLSLRFILFRMLDLGKNIQHLIYALCSFNVSQPNLTPGHTESELSACDYRCSFSFLGGLCRLCMGSQTHDSNPERNESAVIWFDIYCMFQVVL